MKKNHTNVIRHIQEALRMCGDDFALEDTRIHLHRAMNTVGDVARKREKRYAAAQRFAEEAKRNYEKWWAQIVENTKKAAEANLEDKRGEA
jgi:hypothetical protein